jgi:hypothetical protein
VTYGGGVVAAKHIIFAEAFGNNLLSCIGPKLLKLPHDAALSFML